MTLADLAAIGSFISGFAVLISLIFLYFQLRQVGLQVQQAEKNQQAAIRQGRTARIVDVNVAQMEPHAAEAVQQGMSGAADISATQYHQFMSYCRAIFYNAEDGFYQHSDGLLNEAAFSNFATAMKAMFSIPAMRLVWRNLRVIYGAEFVAFMDKTMSEVAAEPQIDRFEKWKIDVAAEMALARD